MCEKHDKLTREEILRIIHNAPRDQEAEDLLRELDQCQLLTASDYAVRITPCPTEVPEPPC